MRPPRNAVQIIPIRFAAEVKRGGSVAKLLLGALKKQNCPLQRGDILMVKHKIVSKAEGAVIDLSSVQPSAKARAWARKNNLDARVIELAFAESARIVRQQGKVLITETRHGFKCANSGVDVSNVDGGKSAVLLPRDPDGSARTIHLELKRETGVSIPVIITDSFGRPWREGLTEFAIGLHGLRPLRDDRGKKDFHGYVLHASVEAVADELACAAGLVCGKLDRTPACIIRGFSYQRGKAAAKELIRSAEFDLFQ
jgi:coenzyme F420-0:L-glutamate ligase/coenzyme F420-1:gamma-L-glutamate ligase